MGRESVGQSSANTTPRSRPYARRAARRARTSSLARGAAGASSVPGSTAAAASASQPSMCSLQSHQRPVRRAPDALPARGARRALQRHASGQMQRTRRRTERGRRDLLHEPTFVRQELYDSGPITRAYQRAVSCAAAVPLLRAMRATLQRAPRRQRGAPCAAGALSCGASAPLSRARHGTARLLHACSAAIHAPKRRHDAATAQSATTRGVDGHTRRISAASGACVM